MKSTHHTRQPPGEGWSQWSRPSKEYMNLSSQNLPQKETWRGFTEGSTSNPSKVIHRFMKLVSSQQAGRFWQRKWLLKINPPLVSSGLLGIMPVLIPAGASVTLITLPLPSRSFLVKERSRAP